MTFKIENSLLAALLLSLFLLGCAVEANDSNGTVSSGSDGKITFSDKVLEKLVRDSIAKPTGELTPADLSAIKELVYSGKNEPITSLNGIEHLTALTKLDLAFNQISDISPIANLTNLTGLYLTSNRISNIGPLAKLTKLTDLTLGNNDIIDIGPLSGMKDMEHLVLDTNKIVDISPIQELTKMRWLYIYTNAITNISTLNKLTLLDTFIYSPTGAAGEAAQVQKFKDSGVAVTKF